MDRKEIRHRISQERLEKSVLPKNLHGDITDSWRLRKLETKKIDREVSNKPLWNKPVFIKYVKVD